MKDFLKNIVIGFTVALSLFLLVSGAHDESKLNQLQHQLSSVQHQEQTIEARTTGSQKDVITCGDLQLLINDGDIASNWLDSNYVLQSSPAQLPTHCINR